MTLISTTEKGIRESVNALFDRYIIEAFEAVEPVINIGQQFAYIGIAIIALKVYLNEQKRADILEYLKWVPLAFVLIKYRTFTMAIFDFYQNIGLSLKANDISWDILQMKIYASQNMALTNLGSSWSLMSLDPAALGSLTLAAMTSSLTSLASVIYLFVLIVFGPLNIGLSFIPALSGMWKAWLQKFMNVCLWIPMLYLIDNFLLHVMEQLIDSLLVNGQANLGLVLTSALLVLMNIFVYLKAPTLSNFIVQGMTVGATQMKDRAKHYSKKAAQTALDAKSGGIPKGIRTLVQ